MSRRSPKPPKPKRPPITFGKRDSKEYRVVLVNGCFTGNNISEVYLDFWLDVPLVNHTKDGKMSMEHVIRERQVMLKMPIPQFITFALTVQRRLQHLQEMGIVSIEQIKKKDEAIPTTYIG